MLPLSDEQARNHLLVVLRHSRQRVHSQEPPKWSPFVIPFVPFRGAAIKWQYRATMSVTVRWLRAIFGDELPLFDSSPRKEPGSFA